MWSLPIRPPSRTGNGVDRAPDPQTENDSLIISTDANPSPGLSRVIVYFSYAAPDLTKSASISLSSWLTADLKAILLSLSASPEQPLALVHFFKSLRFCMLRPTLFVFWSLESLPLLTFPSLH